MKIPVEMDKTLHFIAGATAFFAAVLITPPWLALICSIMAGAGKEFWDYHHPNHTPDWWDFLWTAFGGLTAYTWLFLYEVCKI